MIYYILLWYIIYIFIFEGIFNSILDVLCLCGNFCLQSIIHSHRIEVDIFIKFVFEARFYRYCRNTSKPNAICKMQSVKYSPSRCILTSSYFSIEYQVE